MINVLNFATNGLIDDMTPLSIAVMGQVTVQTADDVVVVVPPATGGGGGGGGGRYYPTPYRYTVPDREEEISKSILTDDDEVLEVLVQLIISGVL